jgi:hypothetical protein
MIKFYSHDTRTLIFHAIGFKENLLSKKQTKMNQQIFVKSQNRDDNI